MENTSENSTGSEGLDEINSRLEKAVDRDAKLAVLREYMSEDQALHAIDLVMGVQTGVIDKGGAE